MNFERLPIAHPGQAGEEEPRPGVDPIRVAPLDELVLLAEAAGMIRHGGFGHLLVEVPRRLGFVALVRIISGRFVARRLDAQVGQPAAAMVDLSAPGRLLGIDGPIGDACLRRLAKEHRQVRGVAVGPGEVARTRLDHDAAEVALVPGAEGDHGVPPALPVLAAGRVAHRAAELVELSDHHQRRHAGRNRLRAARRTAAILHQAEAAVGHLHRARLGLRAAGRMPDEHQRRRRQLTVAGDPGQVIEHALRIGGAEAAFQEEKGQLLPGARPADLRILGQLPLHQRHSADDDASNPLGLRWNPQEGRCFAFVRGHRCRVLKHGRRDTRRGKHKEDPDAVRVRDKTSWPFGIHERENPRGRSPLPCGVYDSIGFRHYTVCYGLRRAWTKLSGIAPAQHATVSAVAHGRTSGQEISEGNHTATRLWWGICVDF